MSSSPLLNDPRPKPDFVKLLSIAEQTSPSSARLPNAGREVFAEQHVGAELGGSDSAIRASFDSQKHLASDRPSAGRRIGNVLIRYCIAVLVGVGATLVWQSYDREIKAMIISTLPLNWASSPVQTGALSASEPGSGAAVQSSAREEARSPATEALSASALAQQLGPVMLELADIRRSVEILTGKHELLAQNVGVLQANAQTLSGSSSRTAPIPPRKPAQVTAPPLTDQPIQSSSQTRPAPRVPSPR